MNPYHRIKNFHGERSKGVGSSDIPILAGLTKRWGSTAMTLWEQKTGRADPWHGNQRTRWGHHLEGLVLREWVGRWFGNETAARFYRGQIRDRSTGPLKILTEARHPEYQFALAHADLVVESGTPIDLKCPRCGSMDTYTPGVTMECSGGCGEIIACPDGPHIQEAKTAGFFGAKRDDDADYGYSAKDRSHNGIPAAVYLQVQWQLLCYGVEHSGVSALIDTGNYLEFGPIVANHSVQEHLLALGEKFWWHVQRDEPPQPATWDDVCKLYPEQKDTTAMIGGEQEDQMRLMVAERTTIAKRMKRDKARLEDIKNAAGLLIGENSLLTGAGGEVFAKSRPGSKETVNAKRLKDEMPEAYAAIDAADMIKKSKWREVRF